MKATINGISLEYTDTDRFLVEVGHGPKGCYKVRYAPSNPNQAVFLFNCINIGRGYKKRLRFKKQVLAREFS